MNYSADTPKICKADNYRIRNKQLSPNEWRWSVSLAAQRRPNKAATDGWPITDDGPFTLLALKHKSQVWKLILASVHRWLTWRQRVANNQPEWAIIERSALQFTSIQAGEDVKLKNRKGRMNGQQKLNNNIKVNDAE